MYDTTYQDAPVLRGWDTSIATTFSSRRLKMDDQIDAAQLVRLKTRFASWFSTYCISKAEERFSISNTIPFVDLQMRVC